MFKLLQSSIVQNYNFYLNGKLDFKEHQRSKQLYEVQRRGLGELHSFTKKDLQERIARASLAHTRSFTPPTRTHGTSKANRKIN